MFDKPRLPKWNYVVDQCLFCDLRCRNHGITDLPCKHSPLLACGNQSTNVTWARVKTPWRLFLSYFKPYRYFLITGYRFTGELSNTSGIVNLIVFCVLLIALQGKQQIGPLFYKFWPGGFYPSPLERIPKPQRPRPCSPPKSPSHHKTKQSGWL